jgi:hypothetical protein
MRHGQWRDERPLRIPGAAYTPDPAEMYPDDIVDIALDVPPPAEIARFMVVFRSLNRDAPPTPGGPLDGGWRWLGRLAADPADDKVPF